MSSLFCRNHRSFFAFMLKMIIRLKHRTFSTCCARISMIEESRVENESEISYEKN
jgi:hypothetical protein